MGKKLNKPKNYRIGLMKKMLVLQPNNLRVIEMLADETNDINIVNRGLKVDPGNGKLNYMMGQHYYDKWKSDSAKADSVQALAWFQKAQQDPQWRGNAKRMIDEINPPMSAEEKKLQEFFKKKQKEEEVDIKGKK
jgi:hypothetical protein